MLFFQEVAGGGQTFNEEVLLQKIVQAQAANTSVRKGVLGIWLNAKTMPVQIPLH